MTRIFDIEEGGPRYKEGIHTAFLLSILITIAIIHKYGFTIRWEEFSQAKIMTLGSYYNVDIYSVVINTGAPLIIKIFSGIYDVPIYNFTFGVLTKFLTSFFFFLLSWRLTKDYLASTFSVLILFQLIDFSPAFFTLNIPLGEISMHTNFPIYFDFRTIAALLTICTLLSFIEQKFFFSSLLGSLLFYIHPFTGLNVMLSLALSYTIMCLLKKENFPLIRNLIFIVLPFLIIVFPRVSNAFRIYHGIPPISFDEFWRFILHNDPDDISTLFLLVHGGIGLPIILLTTIIGGVVYLIFITEKPISTRKILSAVQAERNVLTWMFIIPFPLILTASFIESSGIYHYLPDRVNDIIMNLQVKRTTGVAALLYIPFYSLLISRMVVLFSQRGLDDLISMDYKKKINKYLQNRNITLDRLISYCLVFFIVIVWVIDSPHSIDFEKIADANHRPYEYFSYMALSPQEPLAGTDDPSGELVVIPLEALVDMCSWIRDNTPIDAAFVSPPYIIEFRTYAERQAFVNEREDGGWAIFDRSSAAVFLSRFTDAYNGKLTFFDLPPPVGSSGEPYWIMRREHLALKDSDIKSLKSKYPEYNYYLTEVTHRLSYPVLYSNDYFILYDIEATPKN